MTTTETHPSARVARAKSRHGKPLERFIHGLFLMLGLVTVGCVLLITVYLVASGIPAIREIGLVEFLFGQRWASTAAEPAYGILPFILTSVYGTAGAILLGVPVASSPPCTWRRPPPWA